MPKFERPRRFEVYRANPEGIGDVFVLILSDDIINALRPVVVACALEPMTPEPDLRLPTYAPLPPEDTGLDGAVAASPASPFTLPKNALAERFSVLPRRTQSRVDRAVRLTFGYEEWPDLEPLGMSALPEGSP